MPGITFDDPLFAMQGGVATDWGSVEGGALVKIPIDLQLNRGVALELGIQALAKLDARFQKFISAQLGGQVEAQARVQGQIQMPMNLFREVGFAVRVQAILEASAGIQVGVGLDIGDFVELAHSQLQLRGLPLSLFRVFLEEVDIGMSLFAKVAYTAQAYANLVATCTLVGDDQNEPGFTILYGYGYGLKGGYGMRVMARAGLKDVSRFVARTVDMVVDSTIDALINEMPAEDSLTRGLLDASRAPAKIALRIGYELGEYIVKNSVPMNEQGAQRVALRCVQVVLEESQRYLLRKTIDIALDAVTSHLRQRFSQADPATWQAMRAAREQLAAHLRSMPSEPVDLRDSSTANFWNTLVVQVVNLAVELAGPAGVDPQTRRDLALLWSASQLMFAATVRLVRSDATVSVIGLPPLQAKASFEGPLPAQPHPLIAGVVRQAVLASTGSAVNGDLKQQHLLIFLTDAAVLDLLRSRAPEVDEFLGMFVGDLGTAKSDIARLMMTSLGSVMKDANGDFDDTAALREFAHGLRLFVADKFEAIVVPAIRDAVPSHQSELLMYVDEVLIPSMHMVMDTCFEQVVRWATGQVSQKALEEALSSVIMSAIGRTLVLTGDLMIAATQEQTVEILEALAREPGVASPPSSIIAVPSGFAEAAAEIIAPALPLFEEDVAEGLREFLLIAAEVAAPFPPDVRTRIRRRMYEAIAPLPGANPASLAESLKNDLWIPNDEALLALAGELMEQVGERLVAFVLRLLERLAEIVVEMLLEALVAAAAAVAAWASDVAEAIQVLVQRLAEVALELAAAVAEIAERASELLDAVESLLAAMSNRRASLRAALVTDLIARATAPLEESWAFSLVPTKQREKLFVELGKAVAAAVGAALLDPVFEAVAALASETGELIEDVRAIDPSDGLVAGIGALLLERLKTLTLAALGGDSPGIDVAFDFTWSYSVPVYKPPFGYEMQTRSATVGFDLGRIELPVGVLFNAVGQRILAAGVVEARIASLAAALQSLLMAELRELALHEEQATLSQSKDDLESEQELAGQRVDGVSIQQPAMGSVHQSSVPVAILVEGVLPAFVRQSEDRPAQVMLFLDGEAIELAQFELESWTEGVADAGRGFENGGPRGSGQATTRGVSKRGGRASSVGHALTREIQTRQMRGQQEQAGRRPGRGDRSVFDAGTARSATPTGPTASRDALARDAVDRNALGRGAATSIWNAPTTRAKGVAWAVGPPRTGTLLRGTLPLASLEEGFHTLLVAVFDGAGHAQRSEVTFVVQAATSRSPEAQEPVRTVPWRTPPTRDEIEPKRSPTERPLFTPQKERDRLAAKAKAGIAARAVDPIGRVATISAGARRVVAARRPATTPGPGPTRPSVHTEVRASGRSAADVDRASEETKR